MKKKFVIAALILFIQMGQIIPAFAERSASSPTITIDGEEIIFAVNPIIEDGTTLVQFRPIFEKLGLSIQWDGEKQRITGTKEGLTIELTIGSTIAVVNGEEITLLKAPRIINEYTVIPLRFVGESSGKEVKWDEQTQSITIEGKPTDVPVEEADAEPIITEDHDVDDSSAVSLTIDDIQSLVSISSSKSKDAFSNIELQTLNQALSMDKAELFKMLISLYDYSVPSAVTNPQNLQVIKFIQQYLAADLQKLVDYALSNSGATEIGFAANQILGTMPAEPGISLLSQILEKHQDSDVRYNTAYTINKYKNEQAFYSLANAIDTEKNGSVFGNIVAGAMNIAGSNTDKISILYDKYNGLTDDYKSKFIMMVLSITYSDESIKSAWTTFLLDKAASGSDVDQINANAIIEGAYLH